MQNCDDEQRSDVGGGHESIQTKINNGNILFFTAITNFTVFTSEIRTQH